MEASRMDVVLAGMLLSFCSSVLAQTQAPHVCGAGPGPNEVMAGTQPGGNGVAPTPLCYWKTQTQAAGPQWESRWGAIAADHATVSLGTSSDMASRRAAVRAAIKECKENGGAKCEIELTYSNGCAAMILGDKGYNITAKETLQQTVDTGMRKCGAADTNCNVYYSACSLPVQTR